MHRSSLDHLSRHDLARLLRIGETDPHAWPEWIAAVEHQLAAPLLPDLADIPGAEPHRFKLLVEKRIGAESFQRQLTFIMPSLELLEAIKRFGRARSQDCQSPLHGPGGTLLYYAAIAAALSRCKARITQLSNAQLADGFRWAIHQPIEILHPVFAAALGSLGSA